jgi:hypothetical protein
VGLDVARKWAAQFREGPQRGAKTAAEVRRRPGASRGPGEAASRVPSQVPAPSSPRDIGQGEGRPVPAESESAGPATRSPQRSTCRVR